MADTRITIAGKTHRLRYLLTDRQSIEARCDGKAVMDIIRSGRIEYHSVFVWAGLRHEDRKLLPGEVLRMFQRHQDKGGDYFVDIVQPAFLCALVDGRFTGPLDEKTARGALGMDDEEGKGDGEAPAVVKAAE